MRLTNTIRDAFVRAVMNDVPKIDYAEMYTAAGSPKDEPWKGSK